MNSVAVQPYSLHLRSAIVALIVLPITMVEGIHNLGYVDTLGSVPDTMYGVVVSNTTGILYASTSEGLYISPNYTAPQYPGIFRGIALVDEVLLYLTNGGDTIFEFNITSATMTDYAGGHTGRVDGIGADAKFDGAIGMAHQAGTRLLYVMDMNNKAIRKVDLANANVSTLVRDTNYLKGGHICLTSTGAFIYTTDNSKRVVRVDTTTAQVVVVSATIQGTTDGYGSKGLFKDPSGITITSDDTTLIVAHSTGLVRYFDIRTGYVGTLSGAVATLDNITDGPLVSASFNDIKSVTYYCNATNCGVLVATGKYLTPSMVRFLTFSLPLWLPTLTATKSRTRSHSLSTTNTTIPAQEEPAESATLGAGVIAAATVGAVAGAAVVGAAVVGIAAMKAKVAAAAAAASSTAA